MSVLLGGIGGRIDLDRKAFRNLRCTSRRRGQIPLSVAILLAVGIVVAAMGFSWWRSDDGSSAGRTQLVIWNAKQLGSETQAALHQFEIENPQYQVISNQSAAPDVTSDAQRLLCAVVGGVPPDVVLFDRFAIGEWASRNALTDLTPFLAAQKADDPYKIDSTHFYPWALAEATYRTPGTNEPGRLYGIPSDTDVRLLFCNADHLRQAGLVDAAGKPKPPRTWDELQEDAKLLTRRDANGVITRLGFAPNVGNSWLYMYAFEAGGNFLSADGTKVLFDSPPVVRALKFMVDLYDQLGGVQELNALQSGFQSGALDPFVIGKVSMKIDGDYSMASIADWRRDMDFTVTPAPMPADRLAAGVKPITWAGGFSLVIPATALHKDGAFKLIQYLASRRAYRFIELSEREAREADGRLYLPRASTNRANFEELLNETIFDNPSVPANIKQGYHTMEQMLPGTKIRPVSPIGQLLWTQHVRATEEATNHKYSGEFSDPVAEVRHCLAMAQVDAQDQLDRLLRPPPPHVVSWAAYFVAYGGLIAGTFAAMFLVFKRRRKSYGYRGREVGAALVFASPWMLGMVALVGGPVVFSIVLSVTQYDVLSPARYVGGSNFLQILHDPVFYHSLLNTGFMALRIPLLMAASLMIALLLNKPIRAIGVYRTAFYMPVIVPLVASSLLWINLLTPHFGGINLVLEWLFATPPFHAAEWLINSAVHPATPFHFAPPNWLQDPMWSKPSLILMSLWAAGGGMIVWLAGLQAIPRQLYEAASIDGASQWRQFWHVTLPMLSPYVLFNAITGLIGTMQIFGEAFIMTSGGPVDSTLFYAYYLFREAFQFFRMGYASALGWILFVIVLALTLVQLWASKRWVHYEQA